MAAYPGYVYKPYPKFIKDSSVPKGFVIVNSEEEHKAYSKKFDIAPAKVKTSKLKFTEGA